MAAYPELRLCISGERRRPAQPAFNPFDDSVLGELPHARREGGSEGLACYTVTKNVLHLATPPG
ncbi:hypothetical protein [Roseicella sp. DB1501]|uniref:hypothetical protein n=1 Tax=Roseicella sp. DB1501 TaxID=2730925 RepID=UPI0014932783|nr:hypothetical protein [Roseicella sp. DB1501]NOG70179.1 hypothetical protein [Roseicella sp. DB1501]